VQQANRALHIRDYYFNVLTTGPSRRAQEREVSMSPEGVNRHKPGRGKQFRVLGDLISLKMSGEENGDAVSVFEIDVPALGGPPKHSHLREDEAYYVLAGHFVFSIGSQEIDAEAGTFIHFPRGVTHGYRNLSGQRGKLLGIFWPAGIEHYFEEMDRLATEEELELDRIREVSKYHSIVTPLTDANG
jgi:quercetin dioxygenase-like cupin family protein